MNKAETDLGGNVNCSYPRGSGNPTGRTSDCPEFYKSFFENLSVQKVCKGNAMRDGCIPNPYMKRYITYYAQSAFHQTNIENTDYVYNLADGTIIIMYGINTLPLMIVDTNGAKGPNTFGKDIFSFKFEKNENGSFTIGLNLPEIVLKNEAYFKTLSDIYKE